MRTLQKIRVDREASILDYTVGASSLGNVLVAKTDRGVCAVLLGDDVDELKNELERRHPGKTLRERGDELEAIAGAIITMVEHPGRELDVPFDLQGTDFQRAVWTELRRIPAGHTASYTDIANRLGRPKAVRAVAGACAANALAVIVPCHRVVRSDGALSGYRWGVERKKELLRREARA